jgi:plastocyanin
MKRLQKLMGALGLAAFLLSLTGLALAQDEEEILAADAVAPQVVDVVATDFKYDPERLTLPAGATTFSVRNSGVIDHNFAIENSPGSFVAVLNNIPAGRASSLDVTLTPGTYTMVCTLPAHREAGMVGTLTVTP